MNKTANKMLLAAARKRRNREYPIDDPRWEEPMGYGDMRYYNTSEYPAEMRRYRRSDGRYMMGDDPMIGFDRDYERGMNHPRMSADRGYDGNVYARGSIMMTPNRGMDDQPVDEMTAMKWSKKFRNSDGTTGAHFRVDNTEQYRQSLCPECEQWEFYVAMNMMYSDYSQVAKKMGMDNPEYYAHMAKAFLCDPDAGEGKLRKYMTAIPK